MPFKTSSTERDTAVREQWQLWLEAVESKLGHDIDGELATDGFSLELTRDMFMSGRSIEQAVAAISANVTLVEKRLGR